MASLLGCAKLGYLFEQGNGQLSLHFRGRKNEQILQDPKTPEGYKEKIRQIQKYKGFFFEYFEREPSGIYSRTTLLETDAVTHLVVVSRYDEIEAMEHCFWLVGCFPYLGFFKRESAVKFQQQWEDRGFYTFIRPVYAYSTLGYLEDRILTSFFHHGEFALAELIFHELFHTLFFIEDQVDLNENLAQYFAQQLALGFFEHRSEQYNERKKGLHASGKVVQRVVELVQMYKRSLQAEPPLSRSAADKRLTTFLSTQFRPAIEEQCQSQGIPHCSMGQKPWNHASFSAYLTYEDKIRPIQELNRSLGFSLRDYFLYIEGKYQNYEGEDFAAFLFSAPNKTHPVN